MRTLRSLIENLKSKLQNRSGQTRGRLVRHYFFLSVILISGGLITSGLLEIYFRYKESGEQLALLHQELAAVSAFKIERFVQEIETAMKAATRSRQIAFKEITPEYKFELKKLLSMTPAITEAVALDENGVLRLRVSRLRTIRPEDVDASALREHARQGKSYFGAVYFVRESEPYMTIAVPIERFARDIIGVLKAEVNLKYIGDVVSGVKVGRSGYAYAVTRSGDLIAHPDIGLVLQRRSVAQLNQVRTAFQSRPEITKPKAVISNNLQGTKVLSSSALIPSLDWAVIIERPVEEAYEPLYASMLRTSSLLLVGLGMALLASLFVARRVVRPLRNLRDGVERIGSGNLDYRLDVKTGDEIEILAEEFNKMTAQLQESYANLEQKVEGRTRELTKALEQLKALRDVSQAVSSTLDLQTVLTTIVARAVQLSETNGGAIYEYDEGTQEFRLRATHGMEQELAEALRSEPIRLREGRSDKLRRAKLRFKFPTC